MEVSRTQGKGKEAAEVEKPLEAGMALPTFAYWLQTVFRPSDKLPVCGWTRAARAPVSQLPHVKTETKLA